MKAFAEPNQQDLFHNQVAIVTGAANGIGRSIAIALAHAGAHVVIADTNLRWRRINLKNALP